TRLGDAVATHARALRLASGARLPGRARYRAPRVERAVRRIGPPVPVGAHDPASALDGGRAAVVVDGCAGGADPSRAAENAARCRGSGPRVAADPMVERPADTPRCQLDRVRRRVLGMARAGPVRSGSGGRSLGP